MIAMEQLDTILKHLGGDAFVAGELGCGVSALSNWKARGLPVGRRFDLIALGERIGKPLTIAEVNAVPVAGASGEAA